MKRDDFNVRIDQVRELATKYSKPELQRMVQMGLVGPQEAVMAGMMIDRIAKSAMTPPQSTVAQDVLGQAPTAEGQGMPPQMGQPPQMPQGQMPPQMAADGGIMGALPYSDGVAALPTNLPDYAGGGIVAFADGGRPEDYVRASKQADAALAGMQPQSDMPVLPGGYRMREPTLPERSSIATELGAVGEAERLAGYDSNINVSSIGRPITGTQEIKRAYLDLLSKSPNPEDRAAAERPNSKIVLPLALSERDAQNAYNSIINQIVNL
jgi:hypothetical protein